MDDKEKLIAAVKRHEILYNSELSEYNDKDLRRNAWNQVSEELNLPADECKEMWNALRSSHTTLVKKALDKSSDLMSLSWKYADHMAFLLKYVKVNTKKPRLDKEAKDDSKLREFVDGKTLEADLEHFLKATGVKKSIKCRDVDEVDLFFLGISQIVKKFPIEQKQNIKTEIYRLVHEAKMKMIHE